MKVLCSIINVMPWLWLNSSWISVFISVAWLQLLKTGLHTHSVSRLTRTETELFISLLFLVPKDLSVKGSQNFSGLFVFDEFISYLSTHCVDLIQKTLALNIWCSNLVLTSFSSGNISVKCCASAAMNSYWIACEKHCEKNCYFFPAADNMPSLYMSYWDKTLQEIFFVWQGNLLSYNMYFSTSFFCYFGICTAAFWRVISSSINLALIVLLSYAISSFNALRVFYLFLYLSTKTHTVEFFIFYLAWVIKKSRQGK